MRRADGDDNDDDDDDDDDDDVCLVLLLWQLHRQPEVRRAGVRFPRWFNISKLYGVKNDAHKYNNYIYQIIEF